MKKNKFPIKWQHVIGKIRFRPTIHAFYSVPLIAESLEKEYQEWRAEQNANIVLYSPLPKELLHIEAHAITYTNEKGDMESAEQAAMEKMVKNFSQCLEANVKESHVSVIKTVGFRNTIFFQTDFEFSEVVELLHEKLFVNNEKITAITGDVKRDLAYIVDGKNGDLSNHLQIGPMKNKQAFEHFAERAVFPIIAGDPVNGIFVDLDVITLENLNASNGTNLLKNCVNESFRIMEDIKNLLFT